MWIKAKDGHAYNLDYAVEVWMNYTAKFVWEVVLLMDSKAVGLAGDRSQRSRTVILHSGEDEEQARLFYARTLEKLGISVSGGE